MKIKDCTKAIIFEGVNGNEMLIRQDTTCLKVITKDDVEFKGNILSLYADSFTLFNPSGDEHSKFIRFVDIKEIYYFDPSELGLNNDEKVKEIDNRYKSLKSICCECGCEVDLKEVCLTEDDGMPICNKCK